MYTVAREAHSTATGSAAMSTDVSTIPNAPAPPSSTPDQQPSMYQTFLSDSREGQSVGMALEWVQNFS